MKENSLITYTISHFLVDLSCGYALYAMYASGDIDSAEVALLFVLYNMLAFATQHLFGAFADIVKSNGRLFAVVGIVSTAVGVMIGGEMPALTVCLVGLGNACFHVGGGIDALTTDRGFTRAGIFVSSGSLGIALGCIFGEKLLLSPIHYSACLIFAACAVMIYCKGERKCIPLPKITQEEQLLPASKIILSASVPALSVLLFAVVIRSYAGFAATRPESNSPLIPLIISAAAFAGKFLGGILSDLFGARRVGSASLLLCVPLYFIGAESMIFFLGATFFFNIAMPITLVGAARKLPGHEGFVFGLTTVSLFIGYFINTLFPIETNLSVILIPLLSLIAAVCIFLTTDDIRDRR